MQDPIDALHAARHPDPYAWYATLRDTRPLQFDPGIGLWCVASARLVEQALGHAKLRVRPPDEPVPRALVGTPVGTVFSQLVRMNDGDFHARHRPGVAEHLEDWPSIVVGTAAEAAVKDLAPRVPLDEALTAIPVQAVARVLDVPPAELETTVAQVHAFTQAIAPGASAEAIAAGSEAARALMAQGAARGLTDATAANRIALMQQSLDATAGLLGNALVLLQREPAWEGRLRTRAQWLAFTAEVARWDPPVHNTRRFAAEDFDFEGVRIERGQGMLVLLAAANRDPALNPQPEQFDVERSERRSLGFGSGAHRCPGERVAIALAAAALPHLLEHVRRAGSLRAPIRYRPLANARIPAFG